VLELVAHPRQHGAGRSYLVQHSASSGKSNTIAWLAHRPSSLHDADDHKVFDKVVVITDRLVLDRQLPEAPRPSQSPPCVAASLRAVIAARVRHGPWRRHNVRPAR
jgi:type I restriction enzyme R subunit